MPSPVRVRYAPSPTGEPHVGNIRAALFNWLYARHHGGQCILRIEDTDVARMVPGAVEAILESLRWLGLDWDEGPYFQSQRLPLYQEAAERLIASGHAYLCSCAPERLAAMRLEQARQKLPPRYDRRCRGRDPEELRRAQAQGLTVAVRFKVPLTGKTVFADLLRGTVVFDNEVLDDFIILKSDGYPTYHLANVVDDHEMRISHVMRADEWLPSTPRHVLLYQALGWQPPYFAHLPMILGPDRTKLSKRHGATAVLEYRWQGYLPEALVNFLALLGWSLDDRTEILSREELMQHFGLERVGKTAAIFNIEKLQWMNGVYLRQMSAAELGERLLPWLEEGLPASVPRPLDRGYVRRIVPLIQERLKLLAEAPELTEFFFLEDLSYAPELLKGKGADRSPDRARQALGTVLERLESLGTFDEVSLEGALRPLAQELGLKTGDLFGMIRVATTGRTAAPPLFATMAVLGRARCLARLRKAMTLLTELPPPALG